MIVTLHTPITTPTGTTTLDQAAQAMVDAGTSRVFAPDTSADTLIDLRVELAHNSHNDTTPRGVAILAAWYLTRLRQLNAQFLSADMNYEDLVDAREALRSHLFH